MNTDYRTFVYDTVAALVTSLQPLQQRAGLQLATARDIEDHAGWLEFIDNSEPETDSLVSVMYVTDIPNDGFWFGWQMFFGSIRITLPGDNTVYLPLLDRTTFTPEQHAQYMAHTLLMCLNGTYSLHIAHTQKGPYALQLTCADGSEDKVVYASSKYPESHKAHEYRIEQYANHIDSEAVASADLVKQAVLASNIEQTEEITDGLNDFSWWDDQDADDNNTNQGDTSWLLPSAWWLVLVAAGSWVFIDWVFSRMTIPSWIDDEVQWFITTILAAYGSTFLAWVLVSRYKWLADAFRFVERFSLLPVVQAISKLTNAVRPHITTQRVITAVFWYAQAAVTAYYFFDNAAEKTTNQVLSYTQMAELYPIVWLYPALQLLSIIGFLTKRYWLLQASVAVYVAINVWSSFGGIYGDSEAQLTGWQAVVDWMAVPAFMFLLIYSLYIFCIYIAQVLGVSFTFLPRRTQRPVAALAKPNHIYARDLKKLTQSHTYSR